MRFPTSPARWEVERMRVHMHTRSLLLFLHWLGKTRTNEKKVAVSTAQSAINVTDNEKEASSEANEASNSE